jgi:hypothetical protein
MLGYYIIIYHGTSTGIIYHLVSVDYEILGHNVGPFLRAGRTLIYVGNTTQSTTIMGFCSCYDQT